MRHNSVKVQPKNVQLKQVFCLTDFDSTDSINSDGISLLPFLFSCTHIYYVDRNKLKSLLKLNSTTRHQYAVVLLCWSTSSAIIKTARTRVTCKHFIHLHRVIKMNSLFSHSYLAIYVCVCFFFCRFGRIITSNVWKCSRISSFKTFHKRLKYSCNHRIYLHFFFTI